MDGWRVRSILLIISLFFSSTVPAVIGQEDSRSGAPIVDVSSSYMSWSEKANDTAADDIWNVFFIYENDIFLWNTTTNESILVKSVEYNVNEPSELLTIDVSTFPNGTYHVGIRERQPLNNMTEQYLLTLVVDRDGTPLVMDRPLGDTNIS